MAITMLPPSDLLTAVLPAGDLSDSGRPVGALRDELRRIPDARNALTVVACWAQVLAPIVLAAWWGHPVGWVVAFLLAGRSFVLLAILGHEAAHRLLFSNRRVNDLVGKWLLAAPSFTPIVLYRRGHMAHHRDEMGPNEPDLGLYSGYPITRASLWRKLRRDALLESGWKNMKGLGRGLRNPATRAEAMPIVVVQLVIVAGFTLAGWPQLYLFLWLLPFMTEWRVLNRLRAIAEHGGMARSDDKRMTTHVVHQSLLARFWLVPYRTGWHLAHHVDPGVPFRNLPRLHAELVRVGWIPADLVHRTYLELWRDLSSRPA